MCPECEAQTKIKVIQTYYDDTIYLGDFEAEVCTKCNAKYYTEKGYEGIRKAAIKMDLWGEKRSSEIGKIRKDHIKAKS